ncbi:MAG TPA: SurA N-terminal domain-containing protein [Thermodesulfovibrionales bacterium]|nr:SurA N-terminal domain-containing protein [Thermodesulfovibrionales bacterium]
MLQAMRKHARFFYVLFFIVILSFIFWGVGTVDKTTSVPVAEVGKEKISIEEYWASYDRAREFYRNITKGAFTEEMEKQLNLKQKILDSLIDDTVLLVEAGKIGIKVSDAELEESVTNDPAFMRDGKFNNEVYLRTLQLNRMTPEYFESLKRKELLLAKMRGLIGESVDLSNETASAPAEQRSALLAQLRDKAIKSYVEGLKKQIKIKVNQQLIS